MRENSYRVLVLLFLVVMMTYLFVTAIARALRGEALPAGISLGIAILGAASTWRLSTGRWGQVSTVPIRWWPASPIQRIGLFFYSSFAIAALAILLIIYAFVMRTEDGPILLLGRLAFAMVLAAFGLALWKNSDPAWRDAAYRRLAEKRAKRKEVRRGL